MLKHNASTTFQSQEAKWDARAEQFNALQQSHNQILPKEVSSYLHQRFPDIKTIMDVGGGSGRYALLFAQWAEHVLITDISKNMLHYAMINAEKAKLSNMTFTKLDWHDDVQTSQISDRFNLVFASMSPAASTLEGVKKMMSFADKYCAVHQFILSEDTLYDYIVSALDAPVKTPVSIRRDPHNNRQMIQDLFNALWDLGYTPEIKYFSEETVQHLSIESAKEQYAHSRISTNFSMDNVLRAIDAYAENGVCHVKRRQISALATWTNQIILPPQGGSNV